MGAGALAVAQDPVGSDTKGRDYPRWILSAYLIVLLVCFSPLKTVAYTLPLFFIAWGTFVGRMGWRALRRLIVLLVGLCFLSLVHAALYEDFLWVNFLVGLVTYSAVWTLFLDFSRVTSQALIRRLFRLTVGFLAFQACFGILQALYSAVAVSGGSFDISAGDAVKGTINPSLIGDGLGSNQMFAILLSLFVIAIYPSRHSFLSRAERAWLPVIALSWVLASVMHTVIFAIGAIVVGAVLSPVVGARRWFGQLVYRARLLVYGVVLVGVVLLAARVFLPQNLGNLPGLLGQTAASFRQAQPVSPKVIATLNTLTVLPRAEDSQPVVGLGLGQYSSRAGLIMSGTYLSGGFYLAPRSRTVSNDLIYQLQESIRNQNIGSTFFPYYSWLSIYGEFGVIGVLAVLCVAVIAIRRVRRIQRVADMPIHVATLGQSVTIAIIYLLFLGLQDNYWEFTQAIFPPLILLKLSYDYVTKVAVWSESEH